MWEELIRHDKELFLFLNNLGNPGWDKFWLFVTNKLSSIPIYLILLYLSYKQVGLKRTLLILVSVAPLILVTDQLANFFKYGVQRLRPCYDPEIHNLMRLVKDSCGGRFGYFSAHAANTAALAFFFTRLLRSKFRYIAIFLMLWVLLIAYSRVYIGVHFPLDVISGMFLGVLFGWLFYNLYALTANRFFPS